jgi:hypothetical protein
MRIRTIVRLAILGVLSFVLVVPETSAIPAFARKYRLSCSVCHAPYPRLKPYGEEFAGRGFRLENPAEEPARAEIDTGDPLLKMVREFPIAVRLDGFAAYKEDAAAEVDFEYPWVFKILSGGPITDRLNYYFYFILEQNDVEGLEDAFLQYNGLFGTGIDVILGQFQVSDPLFKRELRLQRSDYEIYKAMVGASDVKLTYDRGLMFLATAPGEVDVAFEVINGNGIPSGEFDKDSYKNLALRLSREFGAVRFGLFGYWGREENALGLKNETMYWGPDLTIGFSDKWELSAQYLRREDDDPFFTGSPAGDVVTDGGFVELHYHPGGQDGRWIWSGLYNKVDSDDVAARIEAGSITMNYLLARNVRFLVELARNFEADATEASAGLIVAF